MTVGWEDFSIDGGGGGGVGDGEWRTLEVKLPENGHIHVDFNSPPKVVVPPTVGGGIGGYIISLIPVNWIMGKELDELTQKGVAVVLLMVVCILALLGITFYVVRTWKRNRAGYRGTLRRVAKGDFAKCKKVE
jgi:hypothetical protein